MTYESAFSADVTGLWRSPCVSDPHRIQPNAVRHIMLIRSVFSPAPPFSTKALAGYGIKAGTWKDEAEMMDMVHAMRERIVTSPAFTGERVIAAILFEATMDRQFAGMPAPQYLWEKKHVVPLLKCDKGLAPEENGVQLMKPIPGERL